MKNPSLYFKGKLFESFTACCHTSTLVAGIPNKTNNVIITLENFRTRRNTMFGKS